MLSVHPVPAGIQETTDFKDTGTFTSPPVFLSAVPLPCIDLVPGVRAIRTSLLSNEVSLAPFLCFHAMYYFPCMMEEKGATSDTHHCSRESGSVQTNTDQTGGSLLKNDHLEKS